MRKAIWDWMEARRARAVASPLLAAFYFNPRVRWQDWAEARHRWTRLVDPWTGRESMDTLGPWLQHQWGHGVLAASILRRHLRPASLGNAVKVPLVGIEARPFVRGATSSGLPLTMDRLRAGPGGD